MTNVHEEFLQNLCTEDTKENGLFGEKLGKGQKWDKSRGHIQ